ncbi:SBBP repeat-containing protein [Telluribacter sp.]|jgi:hypothetical protein|uniref:SBBP repeat-containing protein n=1 Tax=Telluribacter sp. TaxID=1978767 RepID=UPI002E140336|nr:SBBP repeat-containing protein [Telluribacter sp.]
MKQHYFLISLSILFLSFATIAQAQIKIGDGSGVPNPSAVLELESTNKAFLPPRMSSEQRDAIASPASGMVIFNTSLNCLQLFSASGWICLGAATPRLPYNEIVALPSPQPGDQAYDLTFLCMRYYNGSKWVRSSKPAGDTSPDAIAWRAGGTSSEEGRGIAVDGSGNVYVTGYFYGSATFGSTTLTSSGINDVFVIKYNSSGAVQWAQKAGGTNYDMALAIAVDGGDNVYITGYFYGSSTFGSTTLTSSGGADVFVVKYNSSGAVQWAQKAGGTDYDEGQGIAVDGSGNVYVTGYFYGSATFGSTTLTSSGIYDVFVIKYNSSGAVLWGQQAGGGNSDVGYGIAVDGNGNVYVTGYFQGSATFGSTTLNAYGGNDVFVAKYNSSGAVQWVQPAGGVSTEQGRSIAVDGNGNVYVTGSFQGGATFGFTTLNPRGSNDVFVAKYNSSGEVQWAHQAGGTDYDEVQGIAVDGSGNVYVSGTFYGSATFGNSTLTSIGGADVFVARYNSSGVVQWAQQAGGADGDVGRGIAVDGNGNVYVTGNFWNTAAFGSTTLTSSGSNDVFVARYTN